MEVTDFTAVLYVQTTIKDRQHRIYQATVRALTIAALFHILKFIDRPG